MDGRHKGNQTFSYRIAIVGLSAERIINFHSLREWCWNTWGPSCEREMYLKFKANQVKDRPQYWAWHYEDNYDECYIYLVGPRQLELFTLKWM